MTRETSRESYRIWKDSGMLSRSQELVLEAIANDGPVGQGEVWSRHFKNDWMQNAIIPRFAELERAGAIRCCGKDKCGVTGRTVMVYEVTGNPPMKVPSRKVVETKNQIIARLEAELVILRKACGNAGAEANRLKDELHRLLHPVVAIDTKTGQLNLLPGQIIVSQSTGEGQLEFVSVGPACPEVKP